MHASFCVSRAYHLLYARFINYLNTCYARFMLPIMCHMLVSHIFRTGLRHVLYTSFIALCTPYTYLANTMYGYKHVYRHFMRVHTSGIRVSYTRDIRHIHAYHKPCITFYTSCKHLTNVLYNSYTSSYCNTT